MFSFFFFLYNPQDPELVGTSLESLGVNMLWSELDKHKGKPIYEEVEKIKMQELVKNMKIVLLANPLSTLTPQIVVNKLIEHCENTTKRSRDFMETKPGQPLPKDYVAYPGKLDHTTCLAFRVTKIKSKQQQGGPKLTKPVKNKNMDGQGLP